MNSFDVPFVTAECLPDECLLLDCREHVEWNAGHIAGALHLPMNEIPLRLSHEPGALPVGSPIIVVCKVGARSAQVAMWLNRKGFDARNLDGGMIAWAAAGRPMVSEDGLPPRVA